ncbi:MAG TPA: ATP-dependent DNA helicase [Motilibacteraceae bacterium]|nr:ATP-dependent DNA helicase [Motilibacteraceae bacterium]
MTPGPAGDVAATAPRGARGRPALSLVRPPAPSSAAPSLDPAQQAVVDHAGGPLLVLAGPGTGKTTTLVEAVVARVDAGVDPERILVLTFGRKAAAELRERVTARLGRTLREPLARTFHSYAFGVLRREAVRRGEPAPRLLSGPEQDLLVRELLAGGVDGEGRPVGWPETLRAALPTRGFAQELRDLMMRATERGLGPAELAELGRRHGREDWAAAARFLREYLEVSALAAPAAYDPSELVREVVERMDAPPPARSGPDEPAEDLLALLREDELVDGLGGLGDLRERERAAYDWVFVDEYQDTDPAQEELLAALVPPGGNLVVVGDPDQSIYAFRGADVTGIRRFPETFRTLAGEPAPVVELTTCRRSAPAVLGVGTSVAHAMRGRRGRADLQALPDRAPGRVELLVAGGASAEASLVAGVLRRAHVVDGVPWSRMAVLVRSTRGRLPVLRRALLGAGVPVGVAGEELPLAEQPGLRPLLDVYAVALHPERLDQELALALLSGPLGGLDPVALRRLRRELRRVELAAGGRRPSAELLVEALADPRVLLLVPDDVAAPVERLAALVERGRSAAREPGATAETVLWAVWEASGLAARWQAASLAGGPRGAAADRDLDAAMALFEDAARFVDRLPGAGPQVFLAHLSGQEIPGDTLAAQAPEGEVVRVLTAHAAKGLEWDLVVVAGVQEAAWPDLRVRGSLLGTELLLDVLATGDAVPGAGSSAVARLLDEERRLFYVAVTRARERLVVTAVSDEEAGEAPSRFLAEVPLAADDAAVVLPSPAARSAEAEPTTLGALRRALPVPALLARLRELVRDDAQPVPTRRRAGQLRREVLELTRSLDLSSLVAELRAALASPDVADEGEAGGSPGSAVEDTEVLRSAAAAHLARLAAAGVTAADPEEWWAARPLSDDAPVAGPGDVVRVSPSKVDQFATCQLRWLLEGAGGAGPDSASQSVGMLVHALAAATQDPALRRPEALLAALEQQWAGVDLGSPWYTRLERDRAGEMLRRFLAWLETNPRELVGTELDFTVDLSAPVPGGTVTARVAGRVDRLERDAQGRGVVVDLKTGSGKPKPHELPEHPQLGTYQLAVEAGAFEGDGVELAGSGGASLVQLGKAATAQPEQRQPALAEAADPQWARRLVIEVAAGMAGASFTARENEHCDRCPVRTSCPVRDEGRTVVGP